MKERKEKIMRIVNYANYANMLENIYGVQYDREEQFVICPECGEPIYKCDWPQSTFEVDDGAI